MSPAPLVPTVLYRVRWFTEPPRGARSEEELLELREELCGVCAREIAGAPGFDADPWTADEAADLEDPRDAMRCAGCDAECVGTSPALEAAAVEDAKGDVALFAARWWRNRAPRASWPLDELDGRFGAWCGEEYGASYAAGERNPNYRHAARRWLANLP